MQKLLKKLALTVALLSIASSLTFAAPGEWREDYEEALAEAKEQNKHVLLVFTGSDWCGTCQFMDKNVYSKAAFTDYASENLVLVELDFPKKKSQSKKIKAQNEELRQKFDVDGYPTLVVLDADGEKVGELGPMETPAELVKELKAITGTD
jgi:protein disulfide-isomerase